MEDHSHMWLWQLAAALAWPAFVVKLLCHATILFTTPACLCLTLTSPLSSHTTPLLPPPLTHTSHTTAATHTHTLHTHNSPSYTHTYHTCARARYAHARYSSVAIFHLFLPLFLTPSFKNMPSTTTSVRARAASRARAHCAKARARARAPRARRAFSLKFGCASSTTFTHALSL